MELTPIGHANLCLSLHRMGSADPVRDYDRVMAVISHAQVPDSASLATVPLTLTIGSCEWHTQGDQVHSIVFHRSPDAEGWDIVQPVIVGGWTI